MSHLLKLQHAGELLERLELAIKGREEDNAYRPSVILNRHTGQHVIRMKYHPIPAGWGVDIGDILFNLRASLDYLIYELAVIHQGRALTEDEASKTAFPVYEFDPTEPSAVKTRRKDIERRLGLLHPDAKAVVLDFQPYTLSDYRESIVWVLHTLNNIDKHRSLNVIVSALASSEFRLLGSGTVDWVLPIPSGGFTLQEDTILARFTAKRDVKVEIDIRGADCFDEPLLLHKPSPVGAGLRLIFDSIKDWLLPRFAPFL